MQVTQAVRCPFCGQASELAVDTSLASQRFVTDCEVCCRPFEIPAGTAVRFEPGETKTVRLVDIAGRRVLRGGNNLADGPVSPENQKAALARVKAGGFGCRAFTVGVGGPVGSGKTALLLALCERLRGQMSLAVVTNDIFTKEDAEFLVRHQALAAERIRAGETGGCPHAAATRRSTPCPRHRAAPERRDRSRPSAVEEGLPRRQVHPQTPLR